MLLSFHAVVESLTDVTAEVSVMLPPFISEDIVPSNISERSVAAWVIAPARSCDVSETVPVLFELQAAKIAAIRTTAITMARDAFFMLLLL